MIITKIVFSDVYLSSKIKIFANNTRIGLGSRYFKRQMFNSSLIGQQNCSLRKTKSLTSQNESSFGRSSRIINPKNSQATIRRYTTEALCKYYEDARSLWETKKLPEDVDSSAVFSSNELDLRDIEVYGFDYDYTIAQYNPDVEKLIYELGKKTLVSKYRYPKEIEKLGYNRSYAVRGLHYDITNGILMKIDQFQQIQAGSAYRGLTPVSSQEIRDIYGSRALPISYVEGHLKGKMQMAHLADLFSLPEMCLLRQVAQFFMDNNFSFHSVSLFNDVKSAIGSIHPEMHRIVGQDTAKYLMKDPKLEIFLKRLKTEGKETFIITNSPYDFVDRGMTYLLGDQWQDYFDVVIVRAKKPDFFVDRMRPFRELVKEIHMQCWGHVKSLEKGKVYLEGNVSTLQAMKNWNGPQVLYFGDHPYSDLADVSLHHLWRTGAIIGELDDEIEILNSVDYKRSTGWLQILQGVIENCQDTTTEEERRIVKEWIRERDHIRKVNKELFNPYFGSVFRTYDNPTYFSRRLFRLADIYSSKLTNLNNYSINHTFYPRKGVLPHEYKALFV